MIPNGRGIAVGGWDNGLGLRWMGGMDSVSGYESKYTRLSESADIHCRQPAALRSAMFPSGGAVGVSDSSGVGRPWSQVAAVLRERGGGRRHSACARVGVGAWRSVCQQHAVLVPLVPFHGSRNAACARRKPTAHCARARAAHSVWRMGCTLAAPSAACRSDRHTPGNGVGRRRTTTTTTTATTTTGAEMGVTKFVVSLSNILRAGGGAVDGGVALSCRRVMLACQPTAHR